MCTNLYRTIWIQRGSRYDQMLVSEIVLRNIYFGERPVYKAPKQVSCLRLALEILK